MDNSLIVESRIKKGKDFETEGKSLHAVQVYRSLINEFPEYKESYFALANLYERLSNINPAITLLRDLLEWEPENKEVRFFFGQFLLRNSRWEEAVETLSFFLREEEPDVSFLLGYSHFMLDEYELAKINFHNYLNHSTDPELTQESNLYLAKIELKLNNYNEALSYAKKTEILYANFWELNLIYAEIYYNLGMYAHAVTPVEKAIKLNPGETRVYEWAGRVYNKLGDFIKAEKNFLKAVNIQENVTPEGYINLADMCLKNNKAKEALTYFETALKLDPGNKFAKEGIKTASFQLSQNKVSDG